MRVTIFFEWRDGMIGVYAPERRWDLDLHMWCHEVYVYLVPMVGLHITWRRHG